MIRNLLFQAILISLIPCIYAQESGNKYPNGNLKDFEIDAPWRVKSVDQTIPISAVVKDADSDGVFLKRIDYYLQSGSNWNLIHSVDLNSQSLEDSYWEYIYEVTPAALGLTAGSTAYFKVEFYFDEGWYWPEESYIKGLMVRIGSSSFPSLSGWYQGDTHVHSNYTDNLYEYGSTLNMLAKSSDAMGLDFCFVTDHSCDLNSGGSLFGQQGTEISAVNIGSDCILIPGEEVTIDRDNINNNPDDKIHFLSLGNTFIRGPENPAAMTTDTADQLTKLGDALGQVIAGVGYAAHPFDAMESWGASATIGNLVEWSDTNIDTALPYSKFKGLEIWNQKQLYIKDVDDENMWPFPWAENPDENLTVTYQQHLNYAFGKWQDILLGNLSPLRKVFIAGGSDAHGDINYQTYLEVSAGSNYMANCSKFAEVRTAVFCPDGLGTNGTNVLTALNDGRSIVTDGPVVSFFIDRNRDGIYNGNDAMIGGYCNFSRREIENGSSDLVIDFNNTSEFGGNINTIRIINKNDSLELTSGHGFTPSLSGRVTINLPALTNFLDLNNTSGQNDFIRIEAYSGSLFRCYTNPVWFRILESAPIINIAYDGSSGSRILTWPAYGDAVSYKIYSSSQPYSVFPGGWVLEAAGITGLTWTDTSAAQTKKFYILTADF